MDDVTCKMAYNHKSSFLDVRYYIQPLKELSRNELAYCGPIVIVNSLDTTTFWWLAIDSGAMVEQLTLNPMFKGSNPATTDTEKEINGRKVVMLARITLFFLFSVSAVAGF